MFSNDNQEVQTQKKYAGLAACQIVAIAPNAAELAELGMTEKQIEYYKAKTNIPVTVRIAGEQKEVMGTEFCIVLKEQRGLGDHHFIRFTFAKDAERVSKASGAKHYFSKEFFPEEVWGRDVEHLLNGVGKEEGNYYGEKAIRVGKGDPIAERNQEFLYYMFIFQLTRYQKSKENENGDKVNLVPQFFTDLEQAQATYDDIAQGNIDGLRKIAEVAKAKNYRIVIAVTLRQSGNYINENVLLDINSGKTFWRSNPNSDTGVTLEAINSFRTYVEDQDPEYFSDTVVFGSYREVTEDMLSDVTTNDTPDDSEEATEEIPQLPNNVF